VYSPVGGKVVEVNTKLSTDPSLINKSAQKDGWIAKLEISNPKEVDELMDEQKYAKFCEDEKH
jgi:glycine cleavage system H protein